jgi:tRNA pseudouridine55 synthase
LSVSGVLILDKPAGLTSHDVVSKVRRKLGTRKVGHGGTLDPDVTGVLVLCVGDATRLLEYASAEEKTYEGTVCFGISTDTDDASGQVLVKSDVSPLAEETVLRAARNLVGWQEQTVPKFSAVHIQGQRAYDLARAGIDVDLPSRRIHIQEFDVWGFQPGSVAYASFRVICSKGTYVRALCRDWGQQLEVPAHMHRLRRTVSGHFGTEESVSLQAFEQSEHPESFLLPPVQALRGMMHRQVDVHTAALLAQGQMPVLSGIEDKPGTLFAVMSEQDLVAVAEVQSNDQGRAQVRPKKVFWKKER